MRGIRFPLSAVLLALSLPALGLAATAADYDNAGRQLYDAKQYAKAIQYFSAALQLDPKDVRGLTGKANGEYASGQTAQALSDYKQLQALEPGDQQLADFVRGLEARSGSAPAPPTLSASAANAQEGAFQQGLALYNQKQFAAAVPYLQSAVQQDPKGAEAYQYLGLAQIQAGNLKEGDLALEQYNYLHPDPPTENYALQVQKRLPPSDQMWVNARLSDSGMAPRAPKPDVEKPYGGYLTMAFGSLNLAGLNTNAKSWQAFAKQQQGIDSTYQLDASLPTAALGAGLEPVLKLSKNFQVGIPFSFAPIGEARDDLYNKNKVGNYDEYSDSFNISEISLGLDLKYLIFTGDIEPFVSAAPFFAPIDIDYGALTTTGGTTQKVTGSYEGDNVGAVFKLGADIHLDETFVLTPFFSYVFSSPVQFQGNATYTGGGGTDGPSQLEMETDGSGRTFVVAQPTGTAPPPNSVPFQMDMSGFQFGLSGGAFF